MSGTFDALISLGVVVDTAGAVEGLEDLDTAAQGIGDGLADNLSGAGDAVESLGKRSTVSTRAVTGIAAAISLVDPAAGQAARAVGSLARGIAPLGLALGPAAVAIGTLAGALYLYKQRQEEAAQASADAKAIGDVQRSLADQLTLAYEDLAYATGQITAEERALLKVRREAFVQSLPAVQEYTRQITEASRALATATDRQNAALESSEADANALTFLNRARQDAAFKLNALQESYGTYIEGVKALVAVELEEVQVTAANARGKKAAAEALRESNQQQREAARLIAEVAAIERKALTATLSEADRIEQNYTDQKLRLQEIAELKLEGVNTDAANSAIEKEREYDLFELKKRNIENIRGLERRADAEARAERERAFREILGGISDIGTAFGNLADLTSIIAENRGDKSAARRALAVVKALSAAEIAAATTVGIANAIARGAGRPLVTAASIAAVLTGAAAQTAALASVSLHSGGLAPDEQVGPAGSRVLSSETRVVSPQGSDEMTRETIRRAERGESSGREVVVVNAYEHYGRFSQDEMRRQSPSRDNLRRTQYRPTGQQGY